MDPPEENVDAELASLVEEAARDHGSHFAGAPQRPRGGPQLGHQKQHQPQRGRSDFDEGVSASRFPGRFLFMVILLGIFVILLVLIAAKTDSELETDATSKSFTVVHHFKDEDKETKGGDGYIGFHEPSMENLYGANRYYKPPGVGYAIRPRGGLHPIYVLEESDREERETLRSYDDEDRYDDDYELSPYADVRIKMTDEERRAEQREWEEKLQGIRDEYGYWDFHDEYPSKHGGKSRPFVDWSTVGSAKGDSYNPLLGEIDPSDFPKDAWQTDGAYISAFLAEGRKLVKRVVDGVYDEYGWERDGPEGKINIQGSSAPNAGTGSQVAWMYEDSMHALSKKLLNAMMTNDHFFVTLGGHSAAAGHGE